MALAVSFILNPTDRIHDGSLTVTPHQCCFRNYFTAVTIKSCIRLMLSSFQNVCLRAIPLDFHSNPVRHVGQVLLAPSCAQESRAEHDQEYTAVWGRAGPRRGSPGGGGVRASISCAQHPRESATTLSTRKCDFPPGNKRRIDNGQC